MKPLSQAPSGPDAVLILEYNVVIAEDLEGCLREIRRDITVVSAHSVDEAQIALSSDVKIRLAIVPSRVIESDNSAFLSTLVSTVDHVAVHGDVHGQDISAKRFLYLQSPFSSVTVNALLGHIIVS